MPGRSATRRGDRVAPGGVAVHPRVLGQQVAAHAAAGGAPEHRRVDHMRASRDVGEGLHARRAAIVFQLRRAVVGTPPAGRAIGHAALPRRNHRQRKEPTMTNDDVVDTLNDLIETCNDGANGFTACAEHAKAPRAEERVHCARRRMRARRRGAAGPRAGLRRQARRGRQRQRRHPPRLGQGAQLADAASTTMPCSRNASAARTSPLASYRKALEKELPAAVRSLVAAPGRGRAAQPRPDRGRCATAYPAPTT